MTVTVVTRWTTPNVDASTKAAKQAKGVWMKHGAQDLRLSQIYSGQFTGQWLVSATFADMAAFGKAATAVSASPEMKTIQQENAKAGAALQERWLLVGTDL